MVEAFSAAKRKYIKYKKAAESMETDMKEAAEAARTQEQNRAMLTTLHKEVSRFRTVREGKVTAAQTLVDSLDEPQKRSAKFVKSNLKSALEAYSTKVREYNAALISIEIDPSRLLIRQEDFFAVVKTMEDLIVKLEAIAIESTT